MARLHTESAPNVSNFPDDIEVSDPRWLVGTWVTSFISWYPGKPSDALVPFGLANEFVTWETGTQWTQDFKSYFPEDDDENAVITNEDKKIILSLLYPAPVATLSCFKLERNHTFTLDVRRNNQYEHSFFQLAGKWSSVWNSDLRMHVGDITIMDGENVHLVIQFLLVSDSEMKFITAHGPNPVSETLADLPQVAAGTMRKARLRKHHRWWWPFP